MLWVLNGLWAVGVVLLLASVGDEVLMTVEVVVAVLVVAVVVGLVCGGLDEVEVTDSVPLLVAVDTDVVFVVCVDVDVDVDVLALDEDLVDFLAELLAEPDVVGDMLLRVAVETVVVLTVDVDADVAVLVLDALEVVDGVLLLVAACMFDTPSVTQGAVSVRTPFNRGLQLGAIHTTPTNYTDSNRQYEWIAISVQALRNKQSTKCQKGKGYGTWAFFARAAQAAYASGEVR